MKEMVGGCCVCSDDRGWAENPLVYCDGAGCTVAVHQACYGIVTVPVGNWYCRKCEVQDLKSTKVRCELCPNREGALKPTDNNAWAHVVCALYIPEVRFGNVTTMEPIVLSHIPQERFHKNCYICEERSRSRASVGACMQCNKAGCRMQFHVTCAQALGLLCEEASNYMENVKYCGYCDHHYNKIKKGGNVKVIPPYRPVGANDSPEESPSKESEPTKAASKRKLSTGSSKCAKLSNTSAESETGAEEDKNSTPEGETSKDKLSNKRRKGSGRESNLRSRTDLPYTRNAPSGGSRTPPADGASPESSSRPSSPSGSTLKQGSTPLPPPAPIAPHPPSKEPPPTTTTTSSSTTTTTTTTTTSSSTSTSSTTRPNSIVVTVPLEALPATVPSLAAQPSPSLPPSSAHTTQGTNTTANTSSEVFPHLPAKRQRKLRRGKRKGKTRQKKVSFSEPSSEHSTSSTQPIPSTLPSPSILPSPSTLPSHSETTPENPVDYGHKFSNLDIICEALMELESSSQSSDKNEKSRRWMKRSSSGKASSPPPSQQQSGSKSTSPGESSSSQQNVVEMRPRRTSSANPPTGPTSSSGSVSIKEEKEAKIFQNGLHAPHMLGNQLNPSSTMAQKMSDTLSQEMVAHSVFTQQDSSQSNALIGPHLHRTHQNRVGAWTGGSTANNNSTNHVPSSLEHLLERQWEQGSQFLMEQAQHFDIASLLSCLHQLRAENAQLEEHVQSLVQRRDHLLAVNARLAIPLVTPQHQQHQQPQVNSVANNPSPVVNNTPAVIENGMASPAEQVSYQRNTPQSLPRSSSVGFSSGSSQQHQPNSVVVRASSGDRRSSSTGSSYSNHSNTLNPHGNPHNSLGSQHNNPHGNPHSNPHGNPHSNPHGNPHSNPLGNPHNNPHGNPHNPHGNPLNSPLGNPHGNSSLFTSSQQQAQPQQSQVVVRRDAISDLHHNISGAGGNLGGSSTPMNPSGVASNPSTKPSQP